jgi:hypothetical protein
MEPKMCINPNHVWLQRGPNWEQQPVACRQCWRCRQNRVNDYVARCMAESSTSAHTCVVNLTYAPREDLADKVLEPRHFQLFIKQLRNAGHKVRYLVAGEYGGKKGRAHFHALLFFTHLEPSDRVAAYNPMHLYDLDSSAPFSGQIPSERMVHIREWPHGHITADWSASEKSARYVCKYLLADDKNNAWFSLSKKPALGAAFFSQKAAQAVDLGVLPSSFNYLPPNGNRDRPYMMSGATRRDYMNAITIDPSKRKHMSEWVQKTFDKHETRRFRDICDAAPPAYVFARLRERFAERARPLADVLRDIAFEDSVQGQEPDDCLDKDFICGVENTADGWYDFFTRYPKALAAFIGGPNVP